MSLRFTTRLAGGCLALAMANPWSMSGAPLLAQTAGRGTGAAAILPSEIQRRINVIADDSMLGRETPSHGLELTAQFVADEFRLAGLEPAGENGTWFQRYSITRHRLDLSASRVTIQTGTQVVEASFTHTARLAGGGVPLEPVSEGAALVGGAFSPKALEAMALRGRILIVVPARATAESPAGPQVLRAIYLQHPKVVLWGSQLDSTQFAARIPREAPERVAIGALEEKPPIIELQEAVLGPVVEAGGMTLATLRTATEPVFRSLPGVTVRVELRDRIVSSGSAPNTLGVLKGRDPALRGEYVLFTAHMDHLGISPGQADSINNGADDDASGTAGIMTLAAAFAHAGLRPRRSLLFMTVSGEEKGLWGSRYFTAHPLVSLEALVADLNLDMIGRNWKDTIAVIGRRDSDLGATLDAVAAGHPELRMTPVDDRWPDELLYFRSDHFNFARKGVPILFFFNGLHADYHTVSDSPDKIDNEKEARILKLIYFLGDRLANAAARPRWNPDSYRRVVEAGADAQP